MCGSLKMLGLQFLVPMVEDDKDGVEVTGDLGFLFGGLLREFAEEKCKGLSISSRISCQDDTVD